MTEEEIIDELEKLAIECALVGKQVGTTAEWVRDTASVSRDRAFVVNILLDYAEVTEEAEVEGGTRGVSGPWLL
jgi:hypothetical protein